MEVRFKGDVFQWDALQNEAIFQWDRDFINREDAMLYQFHSEEYLQPLPLQLQMFGVHHKQEPIHRPNGVSYYQWFFCIRGQGELYIDNCRCHIAPGQGFLIYPDTGHFYRGLTDDWTLHIFAFGGSVCRDMLRSLHMGSSGACHFSDRTVFENHILSLLRLHEHSYGSRALAFSKECYSFLIDLSQCMTHSCEVTYAQDHPIVLKLVTYMENHYADSISLDTLSELVHLSKDYMCALFKKTTGQTLIHALTNIRIGRARQQLILYPDKKIAAIARECGYESPAYFGKIFKREVGMTPDQYRKIM